jgi:hypothetical protein
MRSAGAGSKGLCYGAAWKAISIAKPTHCRTRAKRGPWHMQVYPLSYLFMRSGCEEDGEIQLRAKCLFDLLSFQRNYFVAWDEILLKSPDFS